MSLSLNCIVEQGGEMFTYNAEFNNGFTGIFGRSGSGKSTLLNVIAGIVKPSKGVVKLNGTILTDSNAGTWLSPHKRSVGVVFQESRLFPHMTVVQNLRYSKPGLDRLSEVASLLDITGLLTAYPETLSGGEKQRVALGRTLLQEPDVLLLDEPFSALDSERRYQIIPFLKKIQAQYALPILVVSHELADIMRLTSRVAVIDDRSIAWQGSIDHLLFNSGIRGIEHASVINRFMVRKEVKQINEVTASSRHSVVVEPRPFICTDVALYIVGADVEEKEEGTFFECTLHPGAISLAKKKVCGISTANQIRGVIKELIVEGTQVRCLIDCGFPLYTVISIESFRSLELGKGQLIYCLFKASAVQVDSL
ncbi:MAG: ATP-binding cassette domain-containing protein [Fibrobacterales bacterium]